MFVTVLCAALPCAAQAATVTVGNPLTAPEVLPSNCHPCTVFQSEEGGKAVLSPADGVITSWSFRSADTGAEYRLQVLVPEGGGKYALRAESPAFAVAGSNAAEVQTDTLATPLPVKKGDAIALHVGAGAEGVPVWPDGAPEDVLGETSSGFPTTVTSFPTGEQLMLQATIATSEPGGSGGGGGGGGGTPAPAPVAALSSTPATPGHDVVLSAAGTRIPAGESATSYTFTLGAGGDPITCPGSDPVLSAVVSNAVSAPASVLVTTSAGTSAVASATLTSSLTGLPTVRLPGSFGAPVAHRAAGSTIGSVHAIASQCLPVGGAPSSQPKSAGVGSVRMGEFAPTIEAIASAACASTVKIGIVEGVGCFTKVEDGKPMPKAEEAILCKHFRLGCTLKERLGEAPLRLAQVAGASSARAHGAITGVEFPDVEFDTFYYSTTPVRIDGVEVAPVNGGALVLARAGVDTSRFLDHDSAYLISSDAVVKIAGIPVSLHVPDYQADYEKAKAAGECGKKVGEGVSEGHIAATNCLGSLKAPTLPEVEHLIPSVDGPIDLSVSPKNLGIELGEFVIPGGASPIPVIPELPLSGTVKVTLTGFDSASVAVHLQLPILSDAAGHGLTGDTTLELSNRKGLQLNYLHVKVPSLSQLGLSRLKNLEFTYSRPTSLFEGQGTLDLNDAIKGEVTLGMAFEHGRFKRAHADYTAPPGGGYPLFGPVFLTYVGADVGIEPTSFKGAANLGIGPAVVNKCSSLGVQGTISLVFGNPFTIDTTGNVQVLCANFGYSSRFHADSDGHVGFGLGIGYPIPGLGSISGEIYGQAYADFSRNIFEAQLDGQVKAELAVKKCEEVGPVEECTPTVDFTQTVGATVSIGDNNGKAVGGAGFCAKLNFPVLGDFSVGAGTTDLPATIVGLSSYNIAAVAQHFQILLSGCSLTPFRLLPPPAGISSLRGHAAGSGYAVKVAPGTGTEVIGLQGDSGAPEVTLTGPAGQRIHAGGEGIEVSKAGLTVRQPSSGQTLIEIPHAAAGDWTLQSAAGAPAVKSVAVARALPEPKIAARVSGHGARRVLRYEVTPQPGLSVRFVEAVGGGISPIGTARGARGSISFAPSNGSPARRTIEAEIVRNGQLSATRAVGRYTPGVLRPGRPSGLRVRRTHGGWTVSFRPGANATEHVLTVRFADGAQMLFAAPKGKRSVSISRNLDPTQMTAVSVTALRGSLRSRPSVLAARFARAKRR